MNNYLFSNQPEDNFNHQNKDHIRKKYAQFFTPFNLAKFMVNWVINNRKNLTILDPSFGLGIFARAGYKIEKQLNFIGYDLDQNILNQAQILFKDSQTNFKLKLYHQDYLLSDLNHQYDGIICNPPYLKFQDFPNNQEVLTKFYQETGQKLSGFTNIYPLFLIKSLLQLKENGRLAFLIPSEFLNANYGKEVKQFLMENKTLKYILIFDHHQNIFDQALTTSCILLCAKDNFQDQVTFINLKNNDDLETLSQNLLNYPNINIQGKSINYEQLNCQIKWRTYYQEIAPDQYKKLVSFSNYATVKRGIATGSNDYFIFNQTKQKKFDIPDQYLLPCLAKANQIKTAIFTQDHFLESWNNNTNILILNVQEIKHKNVEIYLKLGETLGINEKYLTKHRKPWYKIENRHPAPILVGVFNRKRIKFIRNEANIRNLTAFHCIYPHRLIEDKINIFFAYLLTDIAQEIFNYNCREYGGGLKKFEPNDLNQSLIINFDLIDNLTINKIENLYQNYRFKLLSGFEDNNLIQEINQIFIKYL